MSNVDKEVQKKIPISVSVKLLDEQFPWLRDIKWNDKEEDLLKEKQHEKRK